MVGKKKIQVVYWKYRHTIYKIRQKLYLPQICFHNHLKNIWYLVICAVLFPWYNFAISMSFNKYWVAQFVFRLSCQDSLWATKLFFSAVIFAVNCQKGFPSSRRFTHLKSHDSLNPGISCQPVTAPHWRCHPNTNDCVMKPSRYEGRQISHTRWHTRLSATSAHLLEDLLPDLLHLANQNSAGCYLITHFIVSHHPRLHWPFHFFASSF